MKKTTKKVLKELAKDLGSIVILVLIIRGFILSPYEVSGPSMCPYFNSYRENVQCYDGPGEYIIVSKFWYYFSEPKRGDIIVFRKPAPGLGESYIKRIIGLPGETVRLRDGKVFVYNAEHPEGWELPEAEYLSAENLNNTQASYNLTEFTVPENSYFVMGDNRAQSLDSRAHFSTKNPEFRSVETTAYVPYDNISGRAWLVIWPFGQAKIIHDPQY